MTFLAGMMNLKLPETLGQPMPENIADVIAFRNNEVIFIHLMVLIESAFYLET